MTDYDRPVLHGRDAMVFDLLAQAAAILRRRGVPEPEATLWRVADEHLMRDRPRPRPAPVVQEYRPAVYLTPLQYAVFELVAKGSTHAQAGTRLGITPHAVMNHMRRIARAIGVRTGTEAVTLARAGQVQVGQKQGKRAA